MAAALRTRRAARLGKGRVLVPVRTFWTRYRPSRSCRRAKSPMRWLLRSAVLVSAALFMIKV